MVWQKSIYIIVASKYSLKARSDLSYCMAPREKAFSEVAAYEASKTFQVGGARLYE